MRSCSRGLGRWDAEETKAYRQADRSWDSAVARGEGVTQEGVSEGASCSRGKNGGQRLPRPRLNRKRGL